LYGVGSTVVLSLEAVGESTIDIVIDGVNAGPVGVLVVPDGAQRLDVIVGRNWLDSSAITYRKAGSDLVIEESSTVNELVEPSIMTLGNECDVLYVVDEEDSDAPAPLVLEDFKYVSEVASSVEREELLDLVNEYRECFAKGLSKLGCMPLITMDVNEVPGSRPVVCRPYKTSIEDRKEIADCWGMEEMWYHGRDAIAVRQPCHTC